MQAKAGEPKGSHGGRQGKARDPEPGRRRPSRNPKIHRRSRECEDATPATPPALPQAATLSPRIFPLAPPIRSPTDRSPVGAIRSELTSQTCPGRNQSYRPGQALRIASLPKYAANASDHQRRPPLRSRPPVQQGRPPLHQAPGDEASKKGADRETDGCARCGDPSRPFGPLARPHRAPEKHKFSQLPQSLPRSCHRSPQWWLSRCRLRTRQRQALASCLCRLCPLLQCNI